MYVRVSPKSDDHALRPVLHDVRSLQGPLPRRHGEAPHDLRVTHECFRRRSTIASTTSDIAIGEPGVVCAPQQPARDDRGSGAPPRGARDGFVPIAESAFVVAGSAVIAQLSSRIAISGCTRVAPPGVTFTLQASPSRRALIVAKPPSSGASRITCVPVSRDRTAHPASWAR